MLTIPPVKNAVDTFTEGGVYNTLGMNTVDYSALIIEACEKTGTEYIDISQLWTYDNITQYMKESSLSQLYPNEEGGKLIADKVVDRMIEIASEQPENKLHLIDVAYFFVSKRKGVAQYILQNHS